MYKFKQYITYTMLFSFLCSNIAWAGKEFLDQHQDDLKTLTTVKPRKFSSAKDIEALHLFGSGEIVAEDLRGNRTKIPNYNQPKELQEAIQGGYVDALLNHLNLYIRGTGDDLKLELMGGLKGGMYGGDNQGAYDKKTGQVVQKPQVVIRPMPQPVPKPQPVEKPDYDWSKKLKGGGPASWITDINDPRYWEAYMEMMRYLKEKEEQERKQEEYEAYLKKEEAHKKYLAEKDAYEKEVAKAKQQEEAEAKQKLIQQAKLQKQQIAQQYGTIASDEYDKAEEIRKLINTTSWEKVYEYADKNGIAREKVGFINKHRNSFSIEQYMRGTNPFYGPYEEALHVQRLINTSSWPKVYEYADSKGISRENGAYINQNRSLLNFQEYMGRSNHTYGAYNHAVTLQKMINTTSWEKVYDYAEQNGISKQQVGLINARRGEDLSSTTIAKNIHGELAYNDPLLNNGLVYPVKYDQDMGPEQLLPHGYQDTHQRDERLGEALMRGLGTGLKGIWCSTIGVCDADAHLDKIIKFGPVVINLTEKAWKWSSVALGVGAKTLYEKHLLPQQEGEYVGWIKQNLLPNSKQEFEAKVKVLEKFGINVAQPICNPVALNMQASS